MAKNISVWKSIYTKYLTDINSCLNIFNKLERNRTWGDWIVGDRGKINTEGLLNATKEFKEKLEKIISIYATLSRNIKWGRKMELGYQGRSKSDLQLDYFKDGSIAKQIEDLSTPTSTPKVDYSLCKEHTCYSKTVVCGGGGLAVGAVGGGAVGGVAYSGIVAALAITGPCVLVPAAIGLVIGGIATLTLAQSNIKSGSKRGIEYQKLKVLYDALYNTDMLSNLQTHCVIMQEVSVNIDKQLETYKLELGTYQQAIEQKDVGKELAKATELYYETLQSQIEQLKSSKPDMGVDTRERRATKIAASGCKIFLKQSLGYSDSDAQEFIDDLQS